MGGELSRRGFADLILPIIDNNASSPNDSQPHFCAVLNHENCLAVCWNRAWGHNFARS
jgi:hypothetical protein